MELLIIKVAIKIKIAVAISVFRKYLVVRKYA